MDYSKNNVFVAIVVVVFIIEETRGMGADEKSALRLQTLEMFNHAYSSYMNHAYPADELMPLSCKGRWRGSEASRGDIDDCLGNFTLTLIDSLDTLAILGNIDELDKALRLIIKDSRFDADIIVSVFETNIRILGGLLGGHVAATVLKRKHTKLHWYNNELLSMAREVGDRLLPAFNTTTGIPYPRINLKHGLSVDILGQYKDTCTACAGTMILEFAALSRLTGMPVYEEKAHKAMDYLWQQRHRGSDLMGTVINIHNGDWVRRESGVGAGIDSYYEYMLKAYILLGDDTYLDRFNKHYDAVMKYVSQGPLLVDVHMHKPMANSRNFMDALLAFWPGLQVLKGDIRPAIQTHEMLYQIIQRHNFLPEAFTTDFRIHWGHHPLRPEFVESTYFLYKATGDPYYLEVGKKVIENLNTHARVRCGFAAIKDLTTGVHEDQMDSYVLAETFKYLYLLFSEPEDLAFDVDNFIFTTEAHLLPLSLSLSNFTQTSTLRLKPVRTSVTLDLMGSGGQGGVGAEMEEEAHNTCPNLQHASPGGASSFAHNLRSQMKDLVERLSPKPRRDKPRLRAMDFIAGNKEQLEQLHQMGIRIATMSDGRIQLLHTASEAASPLDAEDGMLFMQEMIVISQNQQHDNQHMPVFIQVVSQPFFGSLFFKAGPAQFGYDLKSQPPVQGEVAVAVPLKACLELENPDIVRGKVAMVERGDCMFVDKARNLQRAGAIGGIVVDHTEGSTSETQALFAMSGDGQGDIRIPMGFIFHKEAQQIINTMDLWPSTKVQFSSEIFPEDAFRPTPREASTEAKMEQPLTPEENVAAASDDVYDHQPVSVSTQGNRVHMQVRVGGDPPFAEQPPAHPHHTPKPAPGHQSLSAPSQGSLDSSMMDQVLQLNVLPDGSRTLTFQLDDANTVASNTRPQLHQLYVDLVQLLQERTNFGELAQQSEYLVAVARLLEAAYFRFDKVDSTAQEAIRNLAAELRFLSPHQTKSAAASGIDAKATEASDSGMGQDKASVRQAQPTRHFAQPEELEAVGDQAQADSGDHRRWVEVTEQGGDGSHGASVGEDGVLRFKESREFAHQPQEQQQQFQKQASHSSMDASQADHVASQHSGAPSQAEEFHQGREPHLHQHGSAVGSSQGGDQGRTGEAGSQGDVVNERTSAHSGLVAGTDEQQSRRKEL